MKLKDTLLLALGTGTLLLVPLLGQWPWTFSDFVIAAVLLFGAGLAIDVAWRHAGRYRVATAVIIVVLLVWLWAELAVGIFTNWGS